MATCAPVHDQRFGACTLPEAITAGTASPHRVAGCRWAGTAGHAIRRDTRGGNREWYHLRREERRRDRARRELRAWREES